ncbi:MAG TPA: uridine kinase [Candidatus Hydrogenedentes bacterium]|nr:uridine kinase [Candidatus Hydrogenedentota bacterium]
MGVCIGIAGGTGSGKSTLAGYICDCFPEQTVVLEHDWYYRDQQAKTFEERLLTNYDHPDALETDRLIQELLALKAGAPIEAPVYDFTRHVRAPGCRRIHPKPIIVVEGLHVLGHPDLRALFDLTLFVELDETERLSRRMQRDVAERGRTRESVLQQFQSQVQPMHEQFVEPAKAFAGRIVSGETVDAWQSVIAEIRSRLA